MGQFLTWYSYICIAVSSSWIDSVCPTKSALNFATSSLLQTAHLIFIQPSFSLELELPAPR